MTANYTLIADLETLVVDIPADSIVSRTFFRADEVKAILFGFAAGQELSEHTSARPAILHFLSGEAEVTLGSDSTEVTAGAWIHMQANLPHSIVAKSPVVMLLLML